MANPMRGEVALVVDGVPCVGRLSLGALIELESALAAGSLAELAERFDSGRFSGADVLAVLDAGLRAGGHAIDREALARAAFEGGVMAAAQAAARMLSLAFALPQ